MSLSALGGHGQRQGVGHDDDGPGANVSRQYTLPHREAESDAPSLRLSQAPKDADYLGFLNTLRIRTLVAQAEAITPLGDLTDFAELAG